MKKALLALGLLAMTAMQADAQYLENIYKYIENTSVYGENQKYRNFLLNGQFRERFLPG